MTVPEQSKKYLLNYSPSSPLTKHDYLTVINCLLGMVDDPDLTGFITSTYFHAGSVEVIK